MILRSHQGFSFVTFALAAMLTGCQSSGVLLWQTGDQQPTPVAQRQAEPSVQRLSPQRVIRPGHSLDVDDDVNDNVRMVAAGQISDDAESVREATFGHQSLPGYPIPPPPMPLRDEAASPQEANSSTASDDARQLPIGFGFLRRNVSGEDSPTADDEPDSPKLASPFSLRRLYEKLRPRKGERDAPTSDDPASDSSTRVCEYNEFDSSTPSSLARAVSLGLPEANAGSDELQRGQQRSAVTQRCPSNFHHPLCADSNDIEKYVPE